MTPEKIKSRTIQMQSRTQRELKLRQCSCKHVLVIDSDFETVRLIRRAVYAIDQCGVDAACDGEQAQRMLSLKL